MLIQTNKYKNAGNETTNFTLDYDLYIRLTLADAITAKLIRPYYVLAIQLSKSTYYTTFRDI